MFRVTQIFLIMFRLRNYGNARGNLRGRGYGRRLIIELFTRRRLDVNNSILTDFVILSTRIAYETESEMELL